MRKLTRLWLHSQIPQVPCLSSSIARGPLTGSSAIPGSSSTGCVPVTSGAGAALPHLLWLPDSPKRRQDVEKPCKGSQLPVSAGKGSPSSWFDWCAATIGGPWCGTPGSRRRGLGTTLMNQREALWSTLCSCLVQTNLKLLFSDHTKTDLNWSGPFFLLPTWFIFPLLLGFLLFSSGNSSKRPFPMWSMDSFLWKREHVCVLVT